MRPGTASIFKIPLLIFFWNIGDICVVASNCFPVVLIMMGVLSQRSIHSFHTIKHQKTARHSLRGFDCTFSVIFLLQIIRNTIIFHLKLKVSLKSNLYFSRKNLKTGKLFCGTPSMFLCKCLFIMFN